MLDPLNLLDGAVPQTAEHYKLCAVRRLPQHFPTDCSHCIHFICGQTVVTQVLVVLHLPHVARRIGEKRVQRLRNGFSCLGSRPPTNKSYSAQNR